MSRELPPLNGLRAFEAAGRLGNFARAARELGVTPAAVSHQIANLEQHIGVPLFRRAGRGVRLTESGEACLLGLTDWLDRLAETVERARGSAPEQTLTVNAMPCFISLWLAPRIHQFEVLHPNIALHISAVRQSVGMNLAADVTIRYRPGPYPGYNVERLMEEEVFPVCSPTILARRPIRRPDDLRHHDLIHDEWMRPMETFPDWRAWLAAAGVAGVSVNRGLWVNLTHVVIDQALAGRGVALGRSALVAEHLAASRLIRPLAFDYPVTFAYYVVWPKSVTVQKKAEGFLDWLFAQAQGSQVPRIGKTRAPVA